MTPVHGLPLAWSLLSTALSAQLLGMHSIPAVHCFFASSHGICACSPPPPVEYPIPQVQKLGSLRLLGSAALWTGHGSFSHVRPLCWVPWHTQR